MNAYDEHTMAAAAIIARFAIVTLSDTRTEATDKSGKRARELIELAGHQVASYQIIQDEPDTLASVLTALQMDAKVDVIVTTGGTGVGKRDATIGVLEKMLDQPLPGFGELFRMLSWEQIVSGAMLSRAVGGIAMGKLIFAMPGSMAAVELAMTRLILPEIRHLLCQMR